ncbi:ShlB/FhaC/HecB family hemolysin secretion/activation protein [Sphingomonas sp. DG1-23]|uniref:ShlB/FhaC/HecB family hemolysin secretion/activation protein n=1 Tax=Sphingomonas sp. DG1-23 TaxID=3068316 RepID=UPI00273FD600|nr:ShlB/FhaC/HecB family hemolysin secretion/activation protein [Sphingomonas sp. DG1-23]MDP5279943.1 ShlB/FhaC/HecB family hemolysin secretion/activation protein [Sphingomonas sp. DG1-23]
MARAALPALPLFVTLPFGAAAYGQDALDRVQPPVAREDRAPEENARPRPGVRVDVEAPATVTESTRAILVGAIVLRGLQNLAPGDFADILATRVGRSLSPVELAALANAIAERARSRGLVFASAWIGAQQLQNGVLTIDVEEGRVDEIRFDGDEQPAVRAALAPLTNGAPVRIGELERRLLIAGDIDGVRIHSSRFLREQGKGILLVKVTRNRVAGRATLTNEGTRPLGPEQLSLQVDFNALFASDDSMSLTWSGTAFEPGELRFARVRYEKRISRDGTELAVSASGSVADPGAYLNPLGIRSRSWYVGATLLQPLWRRRNASLWFEGELGIRNLLQWRNGRQVRDDRVVAARGTLYGYTDLAGGRLRVSTTLSQGLDVLGATQAGDPLASRRDADGSFTSLSAWTDWSTDLGGDLSIRLAMLSQLSSQPLLVAEEVGLGGTGFLRGYDWFERSGDQGVMGMAEFRYLWQNPFGAARRAQLYVFVDGGKVTNHDGGFGGGALASAGGGVRADLTRTFGANLELAVPLSGPRYDTNDESPKVNFKILKSF